ncbi:hypothetical protein BW21_5854 [Burkholderia humptydooensis]|nr:hypothetical protein BW21_5854 [Burkholderia sp. 2002721687]
MRIFGCFVGVDVRGFFIGKSVSRHVAFRLIQCRFGRVVAAKAEGTDIRGRAVRVRVACGGFASGRLAVVRRKCVGVAANSRRASAADEGNHAMRLAQGSRKGVVRFVAVVDAERVWRGRGFAERARLRRERSGMMHVERADDATCRAGGRIERFRASTRGRRDIRGRPLFIRRRAPGQACRRARARRSRRSTARSRVRAARARGSCPRSSPRS